MTAMVGVLRRNVEDLGALILGLVTGLGFFTEFAGKVFFWWLKPPMRPKLLIDQIYFIGNKSLFIIGLTSMFSGAVFALQMYLGIKAINMDSIVGPIVAISLAKELAPVFAGLVVAGRCGSAMAAQIGSMKVTEQLDALEVMGINAYQYLAVPRVVGATLSMPMLCAVFLIVGNFGSWLVGVKVLGIDEIVYFQKLSDFMRIAHILEGLIKSAAFGFLIGLIGTYHGFKVEGGAEGVGKGTNQAVVWGMVTVLVSDYFISSFLTQIL
jgi:phospholipid/cholesterol/gamma-HCH transport system permease protein